MTPAPKLRYDERRQIAPSDDPVLVDDNKTGFREAVIFGYLPRRSEVPETSALGRKYSARDKSGWQSTDRIKPKLT
jgi:hypothetical protein